VPRSKQRINYNSFFSGGGGASEIILAPVDLLNMRTDRKFPWVVRSFSIGSVSRNF